MLLSDKYWDYIDTPARAEFLEGSTASGKTTTVAVKFIMNVAESDMKLHVIAGNTTGVIEKNIINADMGLLQIFPNLEYCGNGDKENKLPHIKFKTGSSTKIIYILGYDNASKWKNALGSQFGCVWVDECNTANIDFIREIFGRSEYLLALLIQMHLHYPYTANILITQDRLISIRQMCRKRYGRTLTVVNLLKTGYIGSSHLKIIYP